VRTGFILPSDTLPRAMIAPVAYASAKEFSSRRTPGPCILLVNSSWNLNNIELADLKLLRGRKGETNEALSWR
jgi:hypothetical protein